MAFVLSEVARIENNKAIGITYTEKDLTPFQKAILLGAAQGRNRSDAKRNKESTNKPGQGNNKLPEGLGQMD